MCFSCSLELIFIHQLASDAKLMLFYGFCLFAIMQRSYLMGTKYRKGLQKSKKGYFVRHYIALKVTE